MNNIEIYQSEDGGLQLSVNMSQDTVWLSQLQMANLFGTKRPAISKHLGNIFKSGELDEQVVCSILEHTTEHGAMAGKTQKAKTKYYNLDAVISVGYRVNSINATRFRQWATNTLKQYLMQGYTINQQRFDQNAQELEQALSLINKALISSDVDAKTGKGLAEIVSRYTQTFLWLQRYDEGLLEEPGGVAGGKLVSHQDAMQALNTLKTQLIEKGEATTLFAQPRGDGLASLLGNLEQTIFGEPAYPTIETKAAHLLYFVVKNHPFADGNKRSGAFLFVDFLYQNKRLYKENGNPIINDTGLAALTLLVAESSPDQKETIIRLIMNMLA